MTKQELQKAFDQTFVSDYLRCRSCDEKHIASCVPHNCPQDLLCPCGKIREAYDCQDEKWITDGPRNGDRDARVVPNIAKLCRGIAGPSVPMTPIRSYAAWCIERFLQQVEGMQVDGDVRYRAERILEALNGADDLLAAYNEAAQIMLTSAFGRKAVERFLVGLSYGALAVATGLRTGSVYTDSHQLDQRYEPRFAVALDASGQSQRALALNRRARQTPSSQPPAQPTRFPPLTSSPPRAA